MKQPVAFLDANVLYSAGLRDLLIRLSLHDLFQIRWSKQIHEEWMRSLLAKRPDLTREKLERTYRLMLESSPHSLVENYEALIKHIALPDRDDRHVLAAAIVGKVNLIVTFNLNDFPTDVTTQYGIKVWHPDTFVCQLLDHNVDQVCVSIRQHRLALKNPSKSVQEYLAEREQDGLIKTVSRLRQYTSLL